MVITRRLPNSHISRFRALQKLVAALAMPGNPDIFNAAFSAEITNALPVYTAAYNLVESREADWLRQVDLQALPLKKLEVFVSHFIQVLKFTINRSIIDGEGDWRESDLAYYNLDSTGGNIPDLRVQATLLQWAQNVVTGETNRLASRATAVPMANPSMVEVQARYNNVVMLTNSTAAAALQLVQARGEMDAINPGADALILRAWNFLDAYYSNLEDSLKRTALRQWGVVFVSQGNPNTITFLVKNNAGELLEGATGIIEQTGSEDIANTDGRIELNTTVLGPISIVVQYPGKQKQRIEFTVPDDAEGQTFNLPDVILEDNV